MPKETTYGDQKWLPPSPPDVEPPGEGELIAVSLEPPPQMVPIVDVLWMRESRTVQIVTKATDPHGGRFVGDDPGAHYTDGFYIDLDRDGINKLIRDLRRARDQAFGRDE